MSTTTSDEGVQSTQPINDEAGNDEGVAIVQDDNGSPVLETEMPQSSNLSQAAKEEESETSETSQETQSEAAEEPAQAESTESTEEIVEWAKKKGQEIDPNNPNEVKLAKLQLENDRRFHESRQESPKPPQEIPAVEDPVMNEVVQRQNVNELRMYVRDWFDANPDMKEHREELTKIAEQRPWLTDMDDIKAHYLADPSRLEQVQKDGGRKALENLAQKQGAIPPRQGASNPQAYGNDNVITPQNVHELVDKNDQAWFEKNYEAISKAMQG